MTNTSRLQNAPLHSLGRQFVGTTVVALLMIVFSASPAFAGKNGGPGHGNPHAAQRHQSSQHGDRDGRRDRGRHGHRNPSMYQHSYGYAQPVYVPPPVYYGPRPSPGISLFFPLDLRR